MLFTSTNIRLVLGLGVWSQILVGAEHLSIPGTGAVWSGLDASCKRVFWAGMTCFRQQAYRHRHFPRFLALDMSHVNIPVNMFSFQLQCL